MSGEISFQEFITSERERLDGRRQAVINTQRLVENELAAIDREFAAIAAYEAAKIDKPAQAPVVRRISQGTRREAIMQALSRSTTGMSRGELIAAFDVRGDKSAEMSVSNALTALMKAGQIGRHNGKYFPEVTALHTAA